jgi:hypothetical protein
MNKETLPEELPVILPQNARRDFNLMGPTLAEAYSFGKSDQWNLDSVLYSQALAAKEAAEKERETAYSALRCEHKTLMDLYNKTDELKARIAELEKIKHGVYYDLYKPAQEEK